MIYNLSILFGSNKSLPKDLNRKRVNLRMNHSKVKLINSTFRNILILLQFTVLCKPDIYAFMWKFKHAQSAQSNVQ